MSLLREALLGVSRSQAIKTTITRAPVTRGVVQRYVAGETAADVLRAVADLVAAGLTATIDHLGEDVTDAAQAAATTQAYEELLRGLADAGLANSAEVSVKLSAVGQGLGPDGPRIATGNAARICATAAEVGTTVTVDMEDHTTTDATLAAVRELRGDYPWLGTVLQAYLFRTEADCRELAGAGSRIRLCKGAYAEPEEVAHTDPAAIDRAYVRCLRTLLTGDGYPMIATHDPRLVEIALALVREQRRAPDSYELQMLYGIRPDEQRRLAEAGHTVRVYVPYGTDWYGYLVRRLAEKPANLRFFAHSLLSRR